MISRDDRRHEESAEQADQLQRRTRSQSHRSTPGSSVVGSSPSMTDDTAIGEVDWQSLSQDSSTSSIFEGLSLRRTASDDLWDEARSDSMSIRSTSTRSRVVRGLPPSSSSSTTAAAAGRSSTGVKVTRAIRAGLLQRTQSSPMPTRTTRKRPSDALDDPSLPETPQRRCSTRGLGRLGGIRRSISSLSQSQQDDGTFESELDLDAADTCSEASAAISLVSSLFDQHSHRSSWANATQHTAPSSIAPSPIGTNKAGTTATAAISAGMVKSSSLRSSEAMQVDLDAMEENDQRDEMMLDDDEDNKTTLADLDVFLSDDKDHSANDDGTGSGVGSDTQPKRFTNVYAHARTLLRYATSQDEDDDAAISKSGIATDVNDEHDGGSSLFADPNQPSGRSDTTTRASATSSIVGRDCERAQVASFLRRRFPHLHLSSLVSDTEAQEEEEEEDRGGALYICGMPGTGKTALLKDMLSKLRRTQRKQIKMVYINCIAVSHPKDIFSKLLKALLHDAEGKDQEKMHDDEDDSDLKDDEARLQALLRRPGTNS